MTGRRLVTAVGSIALGIGVLVVAGLALRERPAPPPASRPTPLLVTSAPGAWDPNMFEEEEATDSGRWRPTRPSEADTELTPAEAQELADLAALPYVSGSTEAPDLGNVTVYDPQRAWPGLNLYTSGHGPEAFVTDMAGNVLHTWRMPIEEVWPGNTGAKCSTFWRRVYWYPDGSILAIFEGIGMIKLDRASRLLWAYRGGCHHQASVTEDGRIYVLTREACIVPSVNKTKPVLDDKIAILNPDGELLSEHSILAALQNSPFRWVLDLVPPEGDLLHTNSLFVCDGSLAHLTPGLRKGNVVVSMLGPDTIAIVDLDLGQVVGASCGRRRRLWLKQHDAQVLPSGNILLFDNRGHDGRSKVLEYDATQRRIVWQYPTEGQPGFFSATCGTAYRLPNGNTLITESDAGRAFEIDPRGDIVWEFYNPHRAGDNNELIATLFDLTRVESGFFPWLTTGDK